MTTATTTRGSSSGAILNDTYNNKKTAQKSTAKPIWTRVFLSIIRLKQYESLGIYPDERLLITRIQPKSAAWNMLKLGDRIVKLERTPVATRQQYEQKMREHMTKNQSAPFTTTIEVLRCTTMNLTLLPNDRERLLMRRAGYEYSVVNLHYPDSNAHVGLHLKEIANKVLVSKTIAGSICYGQLFERDRIVDVDGQAVTSRAVAKQLIKKALLNPRKHKATVVVERPVDPEIRRAVGKLLWNQPKKSRSATNCQALLPPDCVNIIQQIKLRNKLPPINAPPSNMKASQTQTKDSETTTTNTKTKPMKSAKKSAKSKSTQSKKPKKVLHVRFHPGPHTEILIPSDYAPDMKMMKVPSNQSFF